MSLIKYWKKLRRKKRKKKKEDKGPFLTIGGCASPGTMTISSGGLYTVSGHGFYAGSSNSPPKTPPFEVKVGDEIIAKCDGAYAASGFHVKKIPIGTILKIASVDKDTGQVLTACGTQLSFETLYNFKPYEKSEAPKLYSNWAHRYTENYFDRYSVD